MGTMASAIDECARSHAGQIAFHVNCGDDKRVPVPDRTLEYGVEGKNSTLCLSIALQGEHKAGSVDNACGRRKQTACAIDFGLQTGHV